MVQLSHLYMTPGKTITFTRWTFVGKVMSLLFNTLSRFVIAFLPKALTYPGPEPPAERRARGLRYVGLGGEGLVLTQPQLQCWEHRLGRQACFPVFGTVAQS